MPRLKWLMFQIPMSSPQRIRIFGFFAGMSISYCARSHRSRRVWGDFMFFASALDDPYDCVLGLDIGGIADVDLQGSLRRFTLRCAARTINRSHFKISIRHPCPRRQFPSAKLRLLAQSEQGMFHAFRRKLRIQFVGKSLAKLVLLMHAADRRKRANADDQRRLRSRPSGSPGQWRLPRRLCPAYLSLLKAFEAATGASR